MAITASDISGLRTASDDYVRTEGLKQKLAALQLQRSPFFLTASDFDEVLHWKLIQQYGRGRALRAKNTDALIRAVTGFALNVTHEDREYELELRVGVLTSLRGVGVPIASAVLALCFPNDYAVIDFRAWRQVFGGNQSTFFIPEYKRYLRAIRPLAQELRWPIQEVDLAIWEYDRRHSS